MDIPSARDVFQPRQNKANDLAEHPYSDLCPTRYVQRKTIDYFMHQVFPEQIVKIIDIKQIPRNFTHNRWTDRQIDLL